MSVATSLKVDNLCCLFGTSRTSCGWRIGSDSLVHPTVIRHHDNSYYAKLCKYFLHANSRWLQRYLNQKNGTLGSKYS